MKTAGFISFKVGDRGGKLDLFISNSVQSRITVRRQEQETYIQTTFVGIFQTIHIIKEKHEHKI